MIQLLDYPRHSIKMHVSSDVERTKRITASAKEKETVEFIEQMETGACFFDVGANVGSYSLIASFLGLKVVAFEPAYFNYKRLCENVELNAQDVLCLPYLLSGQTGLMRLGYSSTEVGSALHETRSQGEGQRQLSWRLDDLIAMSGITPPRYIKLDTDGHELSILKGARRALQGCKAIQVELDASKDAEAVVAFLKGQGYVLIDRARHGQSAISNGRFIRG